MLLRNRGRLLLQFGKAGLLTLGYIGNASAHDQCPLLVHDAFLDPAKNQVTFRYQNSTPRQVTAVQLTVTRGGRYSQRLEILANYSRRETLGIKQTVKATMGITPPSSDTNAWIEGGLFEVGVVRVVFEDGSTWRATRNKTCKASVSLH